MWPIPQETVDFVRFTEKILNENFTFSRQQALKD